MKRFIITLKATIKAFFCPKHPDFEECGVYAGNISDDGLTVEVLEMVKKRARAMVLPKIVNLEGKDYYIINATPFLSEESKEAFKTMQITPEEVKMMLDDMKKE